MDQLETNQDVIAKNNAMEIPAEITQIRRHIWKRWWYPWPGET